MDFNISEKFNFRLVVAKIFIYSFVISPFLGVLLLFFCVGIKDFDVNRQGIYIVALICFYFLVFFLVGVPILKKLKYLQKTGFISADNNELRLFMGLRIISVKWDNVAEIKIVKQEQFKVAINDVVDNSNSDKDFLCINFVSLDMFPRSFVNILNLNKTNYGFHVVYSSSHFDKDVNEVYPELTKYIENRQ